MEPILCQNCEMPIFFGSAEPTEIDLEYKKYTKVSAEHETWRHVHSQSHSCDQTVAIPKKISNKRGEVFEKKKEQRISRIQKSKSMKEAGYSNVEIARHLGVSESSVRLYLKES